MPPSECFDTSFFFFFLLSMGLWKQMTDVLKVIREKKKNNSYSSLFLCSNSLEKAWRTRICRWRDRWQDWSSEANKIHRQHLHVPVSRSTGELQRHLYNTGRSLKEQKLPGRPGVSCPLFCWDMLVFNKERDTTKPSPVTDISIR